MKERPIMFNGEMVRALLDGRKTQTRRKVSPPITHAEGDGMDWYARYGIPWQRYPRVQIRCPYGVPGDRLWVRETFAVETNFNMGDDYPPPFSDGRPVRWLDDDAYGRFWQQCHYRATDPTPELAYDGMDDPAVRWSPSIHMPRWASRLTLEITEVRVERVQDISEADGRAEGMDTSLRARLAGVPDDLTMPLNGRLEPSYRNTFAGVWERINGAGAWDANAWVWVVTFKIAEGVPR